MGGVSATEMMQKYGKKPLESGANPVGSRTVEEVLEAVQNPMKNQSQNSNTQTKYADEYKQVTWRFGEEKVFGEIINHVASTYLTHYGGDRQPIENTIARGHGLPFCVESAITYLERFGKKEGYNRLDLLKCIHFCMLAMYVMDLENK